MEKIINKINLEFVLLIFIIFLGFLFRYFNLFFEDYWIDEMLSFANADPNINLAESLDKIKSIEKMPVLFFLVLKYIFQFFGHHPDTGRYFIMIVGVLAIPVAFLTSKELEAKKSAILFSFFICSNIYLINYSQEVRVYALLFLISSLNIFLFLKIVNEIKNKKKFNIFAILFFAINIIGFLTHPFFLIFLLVEISYCLLKLLFKEKKFFKIILISVVSIIFSIFIQYDYFLWSKVSENIYWIRSSDYLNIEFFTDFYFRKFFGSKIMGAIYFFTLVVLAYKFRRKIIFSSHYLVFVLMIVFSYLIPILYGFINVPVLHDRYIIFVLIPIFALISALIYELKNVKIKNTLISILVIATLSNLYLEIVNKNFHHKPRTANLLNLIAEASIDKNLINIYIDHENGIPTFSNYVVKLDEFKKNNFRMIKKNQISSVDDFWKICYVDVCLVGTCYKDLPNEHLGTEIPNWPINLCSDMKNVNSEFKIKKILGKYTNPYHKVIGRYYIK